MLDWTYCVVGNIVKSRVDEDGTVRYGTPAFTGGTKVYLAGRLWDGSRDSIDALGLSRGKKWQVIWTDVSHIENLRVQKVFTPTVLKFMGDWEYCSSWWGKSKKEKADAENFVRWWIAGRKPERRLFKVKMRIADYMHAILATMKPVFLIRKIQVSATGLDYAYVVTLRKDMTKRFLNRCSEFYCCLKNQLQADEKLYTEADCFTIAGEDYTISFCLEGYKKRANQLGYYHQGVPQTKQIKRMGCEEGIRWLKRNDIEIENVLERMNCSKMIEAYPNPADRFVASVNISKVERRHTSPK